MDTTSIDEIWKTCVQNDRYEVSNAGVVRRRVGGWAIAKGKVLACNSGGKKCHYRRVKLSVGGFSKSYMVHVLVCTAFHGKPTADKPFALHKNDDPHDNRPDNLYWGTRSENLKDAYRNGGLGVGEDHQNARLTVEKVRFIKSHRYCMTVRELASRLGVSHGTVGAIQRGIIWRHVI